MVQRVFRVCQDLTFSNNNLSSFVHCTLPLIVPLQENPRDHDQQTWAERDTCEEAVRHTPHHVSRDVGQYAHLNYSHALSPAAATTPLSSHGCGPAHNGRSHDTTCQDQVILHLQRNRLYDKSRIGFNRQFTLRMIDRKRYDSVVSHYEKTRVVPLRVLGESKSYFVLLWNRFLELGLWKGDKIHSSKAIKLCAIIMACNDFPVTLWVNWRFAAFVSSPSAPDQ